MIVLEFLSAVLVTIITLFCALAPLSFPGWLLGLLNPNAPSLFGTAPHGTLRRILRWGTWAVAGVVAISGFGLIFSNRLAIGVSMLIIGLMVLQICAYTIGRAQSEKVLGRRRARSAAKSANQAEAAAAVPAYEVIDHEDINDTQPIPVINDEAPASSPSSSTMNPTTYAESIASDEYPIARPSDD